MYALKLKAHELIIVRIQPSLTRNNHVLTFHHKNEAIAALGYLSCLVADTSTGTFIPRWLNECVICTRGNLRGCLVAVDGQELEAQLSSNLKQRIEFVFELLVIDFDPSKVRYFRYGLLDNDVIVKTHSPIKFSLHHNKCSKETLIAAYNTDPSSELDEERV